MSDPSEHPAEDIAHDLQGVVGLPDGVEPPPQLFDAFWAYEAALMDDDLERLGAFFATGPDVMRGDASGLLVGRENIDRFRTGRGGAPARTVTEIQVRPITETHAYVTSVNAPDKGGRGLVTQLWERCGDQDATPGGWVITAAHVSAPPPAMDTRIWRVLGSPLVPATTSDGPLAGVTVAVKDIVAVPGQRIGAGVPAYLAEATVEQRPADALAALLSAGASVRGIAQTDQFAYSIAGKNAAYGTPSNPAAPGSIPGGSSSGPATAVASGQADLGLGTDTAGSIRVPASYQGLWGLRPTHGAVSLTGVLPLAPSYDTPGWLARDGRVLLEAARASLPSASQRPLASRRALVDPRLFNAVDDEVGITLRSVAHDSADRRILDPLEHVELPAPDELFRIFRYTQSAEAARSWQEWIDRHPGALAQDVAERFAWAASVTPEQEEEALEAKRQAREAIDAALGDAILLLPSASSVAPPLDASVERLQEVREATLGITAVAGITGRPALSVPLLQCDGGPVGLSLVGPRGSDLVLIDIALEWVDALR
ncbi:AtzH-like domain-containing protein [Demequina aestuarii]|uniref:AtzH-like domain-containing protein n=1 Tax=Demequina aestuarii TaxID=327095 RepID=UPI0007808746|nr:AtzH-like domain-containing protein [Demequina aestuarii]